MISGAGLRKHLPHRYPMLLVDRVTDLVPHRQITAIKAVTCNEPWYRNLGGSVTDEDLAYPPVLIMESWAQAAAVLATADLPTGGPRPDEVMLFGAATEVRFGGPVVPGDVLEHHARIGRLLGDTIIFEGESRVGGVAVMTVERMTLAFRPARQLRGPAPDSTGPSDHQQ